MSEQNTQNAPKRRGRYFLIMVIIASAIGGALLTKAVGVGMFYWHVSKWHGPIDSDRAAKKAERAAGYIARKVDATPEQKQKLVSISKSLATDLLPYHEKLRNTHRQMKDLLIQDKVDREKLEAFRAEKLALVDAVSKRVTVAFADASEILNAEQRKKLSKKFFRKWRD